MMKMKRKQIWLAVAALLVLGATVGAVVRGRGKKAPEVQTAKVERREIVQKVSATGKIQPKTKVDISADVSAKITKLAVVEGQPVSKGALLVTLDQAKYLAAVESAEASVSSAQSNAALVNENMAQTENEFRRSEQLHESGYESQSSFEAKRAQYQVEVARHKSAMDQVAQAKATLKQARDDLSKTTIYSPMAGTVSAVNKEEGEIALGSQFQKDVILTVAELSAMEAQVKVDENDLIAIAVGQAAEIEVDALPDQMLRGAVSEIGSSAVSAGAGTSEQKTEFEVKITLTEPPPTLRPGMTASAEIVTNTNASALSVPLQSVVARAVDQLATKGEQRKDAEARYTADRDGFVEVVFCVEQGKAVAKQVKTGIQSDELIEILDGLNEGEEIVTGSYRAISKDLENGAAVTIKQQKDEGADKGDVAKE
jgi:HlyD family secretion protein